MKAMSTQAQRSDGERRSPPTTERRLTEIWFNSRQHVGLVKS